MVVAGTALVTLAPGHMVPTAGVETGIHPRDCRYLLVGTGRRSESGLERRGPGTYFHV